MRGIAYQRIKKERKYVSTALRYCKQFAPDVFEEMPGHEFCRIWSLCQSRGYLSESFQDNVQKTFKWEGLGRMNPFRSELIPFVSQLFSFSKRFLKQEN